ncbi:unnamed protein product, partial [Gongylonema pulchrum]|uniref:Uncharacterized protein n=1 Tax=Gongylonema pulchrum TaxID=637853 RepID=A0A183EUX5_9BILA
MTSYTPPPHQHGSNYNIYTRMPEHGDAELGSTAGSSPSAKKLRSEHSFMDAFRERLNFRTRRESHTSTCDNEMLDEDLGHPPTCPGTPPGTYVGSLQSDSLLSSSFRSRSRSDVSSPPPIPR